VGEWIEQLRTLGSALLEVLRAEAAALAGDLRRNGRDLTIGLVLLAAAAGIGFWLLGLLLGTAVAVLAIWLPVWGAALVTTGVFLLVTATLVALGLRRLKRLENPVATINRRLEDHVNWWQSRLLVDQGPPRGPALRGGGTPALDDDGPPAGGVL
jgi:hypothetical protein